MLTTANATFSRYQNVLFALALCVLLTVLAQPGFCRSQEAPGTPGPVPTTPELQNRASSIIAEHCLQCHGPDEAARQADLRLDIQDPEWLDRQIIVPGNNSLSLVIQRIVSEDPDQIMPPPEHSKPLTKEEVQMLRQWVDQGGQFARHWSFVAPQKEAVIDSKTNPIDLLVAKRLTEYGKQFSQPAAANVLCRRLYLDIVGLPPSPQQLDDFLAAFELSPVRARQELVNHLLSLPAYGEHWARPWLDVARYSDTNGFEKDLPREQWAWRDWVIHAINTDKPYDEFLVEQIAGDLIPNRTQDQLIAAGFFRNGMVNEEGAIVAEQFRIEGNFDRLDCLGKAAFGLSLQCAQCHSHKFDPLSHHEYFGLFAFFNDTHEAQSWIYSDQQQREIQELDRQIDLIQKEIKNQLPDWKQAEERFAQDLAKDNANWQAIDLDDYFWEGGLNHPEKMADHSILVLGHPTTHGYFQGEWQPTVGVTGIRLEALQHGDQPFSGPGRSHEGTFAISEIEVFQQNTPEAEWVQIPCENAVADFELPEQPLGDYYFSKPHDEPTKRRIGTANFVIDKDQKTAWMPDRGSILRHNDSCIEIQLNPQPAGEANPRFRIRIHMNHGGDGNGRDNLQLGRFRLCQTNRSATAKPLKIATADHGATLAAMVSSERRTDTENQKLFLAWIQNVESLQEFHSKIVQCQAKYPHAETSVLHLASTSGLQSRTTQLLDRGEWDQPKHTVIPGVPVIMQAMRKPDLNQPPLSRLDLANWLTRPDSPLTARVQVNRIWQSIFGQGLVPTAEDFGTRTAAPVQQSLLDWLSVELMENRWSQKRVLKLIFNSQVYAQDSSMTAEQFEADPENTWLSRGPRFRVDAEVVRDIALSVSGLLHEEVGGPSVFPPVPQSVLDQNFANIDYWNVAADQDRYRRSLYVFRKRTMPDPLLGSFDAPNSDFSCARRTRSITPLAALVSLNETIFVEAARALALRIVTQAGPTDPQRIDFAYRLCTSRSATPVQQQLIQRALAQQRERLAAGWVPIREIAFGDAQSLPELPVGVSPQDVATWVVVARVLLNLDETLTKN